MPEAVSEHLPEPETAIGPVRVQVLNEVTNSANGDWALYFQRVRYIAKDDEKCGYRFIWRRPDGSLQAARGQARLPSIAEARALMTMAEEAGWGGYVADEETCQF
jgi:hypothetical protein